MLNTYWLHSVIINACAVVLGEKRVMYEKQFLSDIANPNYSEYESFKSNLSLDGKFFTLTKRQSEKFLKVAAGAFAKDFREPFLAKSRQVNTAIFSKKCKGIFIHIFHSIKLNIVIFMICRFFGFHNSYRTPFGNVGVDLYLSDLTEDVLSYQQQQNHQ
ncbi:VWFA and cache domain-containing protein CG16868-like isoform 1-T7 [Glossina fuscipes fuscipes]